jgi:F-type H+-transporting ATPase subunit b
MASSALLTSLLAEGALVDLDGSVFVELVLFFVLFLILNFLVFKPMIRLFAAREARIDGAVEEAKRQTREAAGFSGEIEEARRKQRAEAAAAREKIRVEGAKSERAILDNARKETAQLVAETDAKLAEEAKIARATIATQTPVLAKQIAGKLLGRDVT